MVENANLNLSDQSKSFQERVDEIRALVEENLRYSKTLYEADKAKTALGRGNLDDLLAENLELSKKIYHLAAKIHRWIIWQQIFGIIKIFLIIVPLAIGVYYVYPLLESTLKTYQQLLDVKVPADSQDLLKQIQDQLKK